MVVGACAPGGLREWNKGRLRFDLSHSSLTKLAMGWGADVMWQADIPSPATAPPAYPADMDQRIV